jgi:hypothetical protein
MTITEQLSKIRAVVAKHKARAQSHKGEDYAATMRREFIAATHDDKLASAIAWMRAQPGGSIYLLDHGSRQYSPLHKTPMDFTQGDRS